MTTNNKIWLVMNERSGSNNATALSDLERALKAADFAITRRICFPDEDLPAAALLDEEGIELLAVFGGDGTINSTVRKLYGWGGTVLALPGGTMNLLSKRLHGAVGAIEIVESIGAGKAQNVRPKICRTAHGDALTGLLAGSGTTWGGVREAMRDVDVPEIIATTTEAIVETATGPRLTCCDPRIGREDGYPLLVIRPTDGGLAVSGYYADNALDLMAHGWKVMQRSFREGPHENLGKVESLEVQGAVPTGLLIDGEQFEGAESETFRLAECEVDLLATDYDE